MKKLSFIIVILFFGIGSAFSQSCLPEGITFTSQEQLNNFKINYPGCTEIEGDITISGENISDLNSLILVNTIGGYLRIIGNQALTNLGGLMGLDTIRGDLWILDNSILTNLNGLEDLTYFGGTLKIYDNNNLSECNFQSVCRSNMCYGLADIHNNATGCNSTDEVWDACNENGYCLCDEPCFSTQEQIDSFHINYPNCTQIVGDILIKSSGTPGTEIANLNGLGGVSYIGGLRIKDNDTLSDLSGLETLIEIGRNLVIFNNNILYSLIGIENVNGGTINDLTFYNNNSLSHCEAQSICDYLASPKGKVIIRDNGPGCDNPVEIANSCGNSLPCLPSGNYYFTSQADVDSFQSYYHGCTELKGDVFIYGEDITNLNGLLGVSSIEGELYIGEAPLLTNLFGLDSLKLVDGGLNIANNSSLTSLTGLNNLTYVVNSFNISNNNSLTSLTGLDSLKNIHGSFTIEGNDCLGSLSGVQNLSNIWSSFSISDNDILPDMTGVGNLSANGISIHGNKSLKSLEGLGNVNSSRLTISNNNSLINLSGLGNVYSIYRLTIENNDALINLSELEDLSANYIYIRDNQSLESLEELQNIHSVTDLTIENNDALISLSGLNNLTSIEGFLGIEDNDALISLSGLNQLTSIGEYFVIKGNDALASLDGLNILNSIGQGWSGTGLSVRSNENLSSLSGLENVTSIAGSLEINNNNALTSLSGLNSLTSIGGSLELNNNDTLASLDGLNNVISIADGLDILDNDFLPSLSGLDKLTSIGGGLSIQENNSLISFEGLNALNSISGPLTIGYNNSLANLSGLENVTSIAGSLQISNNESLCTCDVQSLCDYLSSPNGQVNIYRNGSGCNNPGEIANACGVEMPCLPHGNYYFESQSDIDNFQVHYLDCTELVGEVTISGDDISNLNGLAEIIKVSGQLDILSNNNLVNVTGLNKLDTITGTFRLSGNSQLSSLTGLENLISIGEDFYIGDDYSFNGNPSLVDLSGLNRLTSIGGDLVISMNDSLSNLTALDNLLSIGRDLWIWKNEALVNLTGLDNLDPATISSLHICYNHSLSICEIQTICDFLSINDDAEIYGNASGCNSPEEVLEACDTLSVSEINVTDRITVYPNPCSSAAHLRYTNSELRTLNFELYSIDGVLLRTLFDNMQPPGEYELEFDVSDLPGGMYFIRMQSGGSHAIWKLVVIH